MLSWTVKRSFSSSWNILGAFPTLKSVIQTPYKLAKFYLSTPDVPTHGGINITAEAFGPVAQEWEAAYTGNPFLLQIYGNTDFMHLANFGTVDNPCVVFTADAPFRYVSCTGQQNEDDYEQHELHVFMLKEGPLQRCQVCGQVFKLVRLRYEVDEEMEYYRDSFKPIDPDDLENPNPQNINFLKMWTHKEATPFESHVEGTVLMNVNADIRDRLLTDPVYRLFRFNAAQNYVNYIERTPFYGSLGYAVPDVKQRYPKLRQPLPKNWYESLLVVEKALKVVDRARLRYKRFVSREYLDHDNHERRERRLRQKQKERWENNYTIFYGGLTEEEAQYNDYFMTDNEQYEMDELYEKRLDKIDVELDPKYSAHRYDFLEGYTHNPEDDQTSTLEKKIFKFRYRAAYDGEKFMTRETRMINRQFQRMTQNKEYVELFQKFKYYNNLSPQNQEEIEKQYLLLTTKEGLQLYKDYFEDDEEADIQLMDSLFQANPVPFSLFFKNYTVQQKENQGYFSFPKRPWDDSFGLLANTFFDFTHYSQNIQPQAQQLQTKAQLSEILPLNDVELLNEGIKVAKETAERIISQDKEDKIRTEVPIQDLQSEDLASNVKQGIKTKEQKKKFKKL
ncbi:hypothetical protein pb186bvf_000537 [Paramecium bursaria]